MQSSSNGWRHGSRTVWYFFNDLQNTGKIWPFGDGMWDVASDCSKATIDLKNDWIQRKCPSKIYNGNTRLVHHPLRNIKQQFGKWKIRISIRLYCISICSSSFISFLFFVSFSSGPKSYLHIWIVGLMFSPSHQLSAGNRTSTGSRYDFFWCNVECLQEGTGVAMGYVSFKGRTKTPCATVSGTIWRFLVGKFGLKKLDGTTWMETIKMGRCV